jgi:hypothetical protein
MTPFQVRSVLVASGLALMLWAGTGCSRAPSRVELPAFAAGAGAAALAEYDTNKDGKISGAELVKSPSLQAALDKIDANKDKAITADEIDARIAHWRENKVALMPVTCKVLVNGVPAANAKVTFQPEAFLGSSVHPVTGVTNEEGVAIMKLSEEHVADPKFSNFVPPGFYKIVADVNNKQYSTGPRTGCEIATDAGWLGEGCVTAEFESR